MRALVGELGRALSELARMVDDLSEEDFELRLAAAEPEVDLGSIQLVVHHVVRAGYAHINYVRVALGVEGRKVEVPIGSRSQVSGQFKALREYFAETFKERQTITDEKLDSLRVEARWGPVYTVEQMMEHAIVHVLRHRRQLEQLLAAPGRHSAREEFAHLEVCIEALGGTWSLLRAVRAAPPDCPLLLPALRFAIVQYASSYTDAKGSAKKRHKLKLPGELETEFGELHRYLLLRRHQLHAHNDLELLDPRSSVRKVEQRKIAVVAFNIVDPGEEFSKLEQIICLVEKTLEILQARRDRDEANLASD